MGERLDPITSTQRHLLISHILNIDTNTSKN